MKTTLRFGFAALLIAASSVAAQSNSGATGTPAGGDTTGKESPKKISLYRPMDINHIRPSDMRGVNVFESPKEDQVPFNGFALVLTRRSETAERFSVVVEPKPLLVQVAHGVSSTLEDFLRIKLRIVIRIE